MSVYLHIIHLGDGLGIGIAQRFISPVVTFTVFILFHRETVANGHFLVEDILLHVVGVVVLGHHGPVHRILGNGDINPFITGRDVILVGSFGEGDGGFSGLTRGFVTVSFRHHGLCRGFSGNAGD